MCLAHLHAGKKESALSVDLEFVNAILGANTSMYFVSFGVDLIGGRFLQGTAIVTPSKPSSVVW